MEGEVGAFVAGALGDHGEGTVFELPVDAELAAFEGEFAFDDDGGDGSAAVGGGHEGDADFVRERRRAEDEGAACGVRGSAGGETVGEVDGAVVAFDDVGEAPCAG